MKAEIVASELRLNFFSKGKRIRARISLDEIKKSYLEKSGNKQVGHKGAITLSEFTTQIYLKLHTPKKRPGTQKRQRIIVKNLNARLGAMYLHEISEYVVEQYRNERSKDKSPVTGKELRPATVNRDTSQFKHMMKMAKKWGYLLSNPLVDFEKLPEMNERDRWLTREELARLLDSLVGWMKDFVELLAWTGLRLTELRTLRWENVKFEEGYICAETEKQQKRPLTRYIHLRSRVKQILLRMHANVTGMSGYVFPSSTSKPRTANVVEVAFRKGLKRSGIEHCTLHDLRRTFAVHHAMVYKDLFMLRDELGHSDFRTMHRYARFSGIYNSRHSIFKNDLDIVQ